VCKNDNIVKDIGDNILDFTVYLSNVIIQVKKGGLS